MGFWKRAAPVCPLCHQDLPKGANRIQHWTSHVTPISSGPDTGSFTWRCPTHGPSDMCWEKDYAAGAGLAVHMQQKHLIPMV